MRASDSEDRDTGYARRSLARALAAAVVGRAMRAPPSDILRSAWPDDMRARAISSPTSTTTTGGALLATLTGNLLLIAPGSAAAVLFQRTMSLDFAGVYQFLIPFASMHPTPLFVAEGAPAPVAQAAFGHTLFGPVSKLIFITSYSRELENATPETLATILGRLMNESASKSLDAAVFGSAPADTTRPAGLLYGVAPLTAAPAGASSIDTAASDIAAFAAAFSAAGINSLNMTLIANPAQAWKLRMVLGYQNLDLLVLPSIGLAPGTVVSVVPEAIATGFDGAPEIEVSQQPNLHFDGSVPLEIVNAAGAVAAPDISTFQLDLSALKLRLRCTWQSIQPGATQYMVNVNW